MRTIRCINNEGISTPQSEEASSGRTVGKAKPAACGKTKAPIPIAKALPIRSPVHTREDWRLCQKDSKQQMSAAIPTNTKMASL